jgi:Co/Zn/Cd efflux system component
LRSSARVLLDRQLDDELVKRIRTAIERDQTTVVADLHVWSLGPGIHAAEISVVAREPLSPEQYRKRLPDFVSHVTIEVHQNPEPGRHEEAGRSASSR